MKELNLETKIELFEMAAEKVDTYEDIRVYSYFQKVRSILDSIMTFEVTPTNPAESIDRLERILKILEEKIRMRQNYKLVMRQSDLNL